MPSTALRILLAEDDELFRLGLRMRLQEAGLEVVAEAEDGETAVELAQRHVLDVVLLDVGLPGVGGIEACRQIKHHLPALPILILTSHTEKALIGRLIAVGAQGYCLKGIPSETIVLALRSVAAGASWWDATATTEIRAALRAQTLSLQSAPSAGGNSLTRREQEILALIANGKTNQEISEQLHIAPGTVRVHVHAILSKLNVHDRAQAVLVAVKQNLVDRDLLQGEPL
jgi:two-component system NarL family response regulator